MLVFKEGATPIWWRPEIRVELADVTSPTDPTSSGEVQEERAETVTGGKAVHKTGGVGDIVVVELAVHPALVSQDVRLSVGPGAQAESHSGIQLSFKTRGSYGAVRR